MDEPDRTIEHTPDDILRTAVLFESSLGILAIILGWLLGPDARQLVPDLDVAALWPIAKSLLIGCVGAIPVLIVIEIVRRIPCEPVRQLERLSDDGVVKLLLRLRPSELLLISICAGVGEELLFRGWLMPWLAGGSLEAGPWELGVGLIGSSIAFGLVHPITKLYIFLAALMGCYFGFLLILTGNLLVPIAAHAAYDAAQLLLTSRQQSQGTS